MRPATRDRESAAAQATEAWSRRVLRIGGLIQTGFAAFWLVRAGLVIGMPMGVLVAVCLGAVATAVFVYGIHHTAGRAPRPHGPEAARLERVITLATIAQLVASFVAPAIVIATGHDDWVLPSVAITIGPLLLWLGVRLAIARYRFVGWSLIIGPPFLVAIMSGTALVVTTGLAAGTLLLTTAAIGFHELGAVPPAGAWSIQR